MEDHLSEHVTSVDEQTEDSSQLEDREKRLRTLLRETSVKNTALENELANSKALLSKMMDELSRVRAEFNAYVTASKEGILNLGQETERLRTELREKTDQLVKMESKTMMLSQIGVMDTDDFDSIKEEIMESSAQLRGENEALRETLQKAEEKALKDIQKLHQLQKQYQENLEQNRKFTSEQKRFELEFDTLQQDRDMLEQKYLELQASKNQLEKQTAGEQILQISLQRAREKVIEQQTLIEHLKTEFSDITGKYTAATHQLIAFDEQEKQITQLTASLDENRTQVTELMGKLSVAEHRLERGDDTVEQLSKLSQQVDAYRIRVSEAERQYGVALHRLETLDEKEEQLTILSQQVKEYKAQISELKYQSQIAEKQKETLSKTREELNNLHELHEHAKIEISRLEKANTIVQEQEEAINKLQKENTSFKAQISALNAEIDTITKYKGQLNESQDAVSDLMSRIAGMASKVTTLKSEIKIYEQDRERYQKEKQTEIIRLNERIGELQSELDTISADNYKKESEIESLETQVRESEAQLATVQESISRTLNIDEKLQALSTQSAERKMSLEKRLEVFELTADGVNKMKEDLAKERQSLHEKIEMITIYEQVLQNTELGKIFLLVKALRTTNVDHLSRALGIPKLNLRSSVRELSELGLIQIAKDNVTFLKSEEAKTPA